MSLILLENITYLLLFLVFLYIYFLIILQCDFISRFWVTISIFVLIPLYTILIPKISIFKGIYDLYYYLSFSSVTSTLFHYRLILILLFFILSFLCAYRLVIIILSDNSEKISSRVLSFSRIFCYCGLSSILLFSRFFNYVHTHLNYNIKSMGFVHLYINLLIMLIMAIILSFVSYFLAVLFVYFSDVFNISRNSMFCYMFRQCFWYCGYHRNLDKQIKRHYKQGFSVNNLKKYYHLSKNIIRFIISGKITD